MRVLFFNVKLKLRRFSSGKNILGSENIYTTHNQQFHWDVLRRWWLIICRVKITFVCCVKITFKLLRTTFSVSIEANLMKCFVNLIPLNSHVRLNKIQPYLKAGLEFVRNEHAYSVESSLQGISSNSLLWKRNELLVIIQTWSWRGKPAASART